MKFRACLLLLSMMVVTLGMNALAQEQKAAAPAKEGILKPGEVAGKFFPEKVFFRGQVATVQARNAAGVRYADELLVMAALVDSSGYSSAIREKYQAYLITEVPLEIGGHTLRPGAYGAGFLEGNKFVVMDLGANDILQANSAKDAEMKRPVPLQFVEGAAGTYRLYKGREYVELKRTK
jgi:hypothetical protein